MGAESWAAAEISYGVVTIRQSGHDDGQGQDDISRTSEMLQNS